MRQNVAALLVFSTLSLARPVEDTEKRAPPFQTISTGGLQALLPYLQALAAGVPVGSSTTLPTGTGLAGQVQGAVQGVVQGVGSAVSGAAGQVVGAVTGLGGSLASGSSLLGQDKALAGAIPVAFQGNTTTGNGTSGGNGTTTCPTGCYVCDPNGNSCICSCTAAENLALIAGAVFPPINASLSALSDTIESELATLPCAVVSGIQNPSFERDNGTLDGWDIYIKPTLNPGSSVAVDATHHYPDQYGGQGPTEGHSLEINVLPGELVEVFNVIPVVCPGNTISSSIQVLSTSLPSCDVYFGMMPALDNNNYYPAMQTATLQSLYESAGTSAGTTWLNLTSQDTLYANTTSGALTFVVDCTNYAPYIPATGITYWIDYAFFFS